MPELLLVSGGGSAYRFYDLFSYSRACVFFPPATIVVVADSRQNDRYRISMVLGFVMVCTISTKNPSYVARKSVGPVWNSRDQQKLIFFAAPLF